ncbi:MAG: ribulose-phosphate 3-epimerase [Candidatus Cloacimonadales bacterium]|jgi:ribulose-phosphate 3-epimerase|nr:ribulose-phosphate 3-epimerase [Candidatus Cloacimonadota bacterium]MDY0380883.1 ribulose-phosphate 3-epimerase [Candidatus Cloacimonadaceae bacterium]HCM16266.1 ribulose-phosphate 3-epimerase [Candidatus Cloacimonas sp.]MCB5256352.1 ribulose-phosphate 3-epimerase [Candidatus Cloacimonadota bacterium]MCB5263480.1 ribulose-phosphate 3-epimerase [Candidatus Cloacimonadota bacterium]
MSVKIAASVLSADFGHLADEINKLEATDIIHLDLMDGHYVPNLSFGYPFISAIRKLTNKALDAHLMVTNPDDYVEQLAEIGIQYLSFHQETVYHSHRLVQRIKSFGIKAGIALNPATPVHSLDDILSELDFVLVMSVNPGYSAQKFIPHAITKVKQLNALKATYPNFLIEVDGGVNGDNSRDLISAGTDILVSASYIFASQDYTASINTLKGE